MTIKAIKAIKAIKTKASQNILPLSEALDVDLVGGKAINLARMMQADLPVPGGFVVTTHAFRHSENGRVSDELAQEITEAYEAMDVNLVVARSSATAEDMAGASMAGQYETYLNLMSAKDLIDGVERCWRSLYSERITAYLKEHGIDPEKVAMAVVVQQLVAADVAGVLFTADPKTGSEDNMLIEATWGLGDTLVSGEVQPDVISVRAHQPKVNSYEVATKKHILHPGSKELYPVRDEDQNRACLTYEQILRLQELGRFAVKYFDGPQDIEWAIEAGEIYMLQSRPITTLNETVALQQLLSDTKLELSSLMREGHGPWVRHNLGETLPRPTPLTWGILSEFMSGDGGFGIMHEQVGFIPGPKVREGRSFLKQIGSEIYMDCSLMTEMFAENYPYRYDAELLRSDPDAAQKPPSIAEGSMSELGTAASMAVTVTDTIKAMAVDLDQRFDREFVPEVEGWCKTQEATDFSKLNDRELGDYWQAQVSKVLGEFGQMAFLPSMVEALAVDDLSLFLEEHAWEEEPSELLSLFSVGKTPDKTLQANIELSQVRKGELTIESWLASYGHRAPGEFELATPRWSERPEDARRMAGLIAKDSHVDKHHEERLQAVDDFLAYFQGNLSPELHQELKRRVDLVQRYCRFREDGKFYLMKAYSVLRATALALGQRLRIDEAIFYLKPNEVIEALQTGFVPKDRIAEREVRYRIEHRLKLPHVIDREDIASLGEPKVYSDGPSVAAHSVSGGVATGKVMIVLEPEAVSHLPQGSILVCPSTDPSWTPLFANAAGVVLERGGSLSHGAVVAREMGLPAVVLDGATKQFKDGDSITVDANSGVILRDGATSFQDKAEISAAGSDTHIERKLVPPPPGKWEQQVNQIGMLCAVFWGVLLAAIFLLPPTMLNDPVMGMLDAMIWPLIRSFGMMGAVGIIAAAFGVVPIVAQRYLTDNRRLVEAKRRCGLLRKAANELPVDSPRRKRMETLVSPITMRILKASMVPLAMILGPMIMIFMWFPARVDPASWSADPGRMVSVVLEIDGECQEDISLLVPEPLAVDESIQRLPPIRQELEELRQEWQVATPMIDLPWEVRSAGDHTRKMMLASLNAYLAHGVAPQKVTWLVEVPEEAVGTHQILVRIGGQENATESTDSSKLTDASDKAKGQESAATNSKLAAAFPMVFGRKDPPAPAMIESLHPALKSVTVNYPRALQKPVFWTPLKAVGGPGWDFGWLGIYLLVYLPLMFIAKVVLRVP